MRTYRVRDRAEESTGRSTSCSPFNECYSYTNQLLPKRSWSKRCRMFYPTKTATLSSPYRARPNDVRLTLFYSSPAELLHLPGLHVLSVGSCSTRASAGPCRVKSARARVDCAFKPRDEENTTGRSRNPKTQDTRGLCQEVKTKEEDGR